MSYLYIWGTLVLTVYGQIVLKWRISHYGVLPNDFLLKIKFLLKLCIDPFVLSGFFAAFLAALCWMAAMTKFELSYAYTFMSLSFVVVLILSALFFHEPITAAKVLGVIFIIAGIIIGTRG